MMDGVVVVTKFVIIPGKQCVDFWWLFYRITQLCIQLYCKNPHVLDPFRTFIHLPSNRTIR